ncbi:hypothetical protein NDU88_002195 [Pleurodeles waltl]|uniref:Uncharacterized protein n=1 Tax=Pleurodeles waltl TaxID=8319 RepID=A0AAV7UCI2_PLEWA|nr:hypothetical protein NDU88_002195 [Pleurodeles waltl]
METRTEELEIEIRAFLLPSMTQGWRIDKIKLMEVSRYPTSCGIKNLYPLLLNTIQDDLALLVKKWEGRVGAKEAELACRLHCSSVCVRLRLDAGRMPPKGAKATPPAVRRKQTRMNTAGRPGASDEVKHEIKRGPHEKTQIPWVATTCSEFATRIEEVETRTSRLEDDVGSQKAIGDTMGKQLEDAQWS